MRAPALLLLTCLCCSAQTTNLPSPNVRAWGALTNVPLTLTNAVAIAANWNHTVVLRSDRTVVDIGNSEPPPTLSNVVAIAAGFSYGEAVTSDGGVVGWGAATQAIPETATNIIAITAFNAVTVAVTRNGSVMAWGGVINSIQTNLPSTLSNVVAVAVGNNHALALKNDGTVAAWGTNYDFLGQHTGALDVPAGLSNVIAVAAAADYSMALVSDGTVSIWGRAPVFIPWLTDVVAIAAGQSHFMEIRGDGSVGAWGNNSNNQCDVPPDLPFAQAVTCGLNSSVALVVPGAAVTAPIILASPATQTVSIGSTVRFFVNAAGVKPFNYQWYFNATNPIAGGTNQMLILTNVQSTQAGSYHVSVSNGAGGTLSQPASLSVIPALDVRLVPAIGLYGDVGRSYRLDYINAVGPTNAWVALDTITITNTGQLYFDVSAVGKSARFYRLVQLP